MLKVYHSNRLERLLDRLGEVAGESAVEANPLAPEHIVTQSQGMARWVALGLAERHGIAANIAFSFPASFIWQLFSSQIPGVADASAFDRDALTWRLMGELPQWLERPGFEPLHHYLSGERRALKQYQLARRIADVFDQYLIYRPEMVLAWEQGAERDWQAQLWRGLAGGSAGAAHRAALLQRFLALADQGRLDPAKLPARLSMFGISTLPPAYLEVLHRVAALTEVHLFVLNPCLAYWGDIQDARTIARLRRLRRSMGRAEETDYLTAGNGLLASMGRQGRDFIDALHGYMAVDEELFQEPAGDSLLSLLQGDILALEERGAADARHTLDPEDHSVQVHACHSPMREVEVLHDQLLALFQQRPELRPRDVVVMTPNIEDYAPYIEAVFGAAADQRHIPWAIADLSRQSEHGLVQAFLQVLELAQSRFTANQVLSLLEVPAVLRRFRLDLADFDTVRRWVRDSGIRWGLDGRDRARLDLPQVEENTWEFGLKRLFLGYAMPASEQLFQGVAPCSGVEGQRAEALGKLRAFVALLASTRERLGGQYTAPEWAALASGLLDDFFAPDEDDADAVQIVQDALAALVDEAERGAFAGRFPLEVLREHLSEGLTEPSTGQRFLTGKLTFCAMIPMRSLPFRVVCMIGMNDGVFPRQHRPVGFDRMAADPRPGDRARREDDRYLFLEALLSARDTLYISYLGRNIRDNTTLLPSVLVSELLDYIDAGFTAGQGEARARLITEHPLQPFSPRYFTGGEAHLFSYADEWLARPDPHAPGQGEAFCPAPLPTWAEPAAGPAAEPVDLAALLAFFHHPARTFLRERLGIWLDEREDVLADDEPFALDQLARHGLRECLLGQALRGVDPAAGKALLKARGLLPSAGFADLVVDEQLPTIQEFAAILPEQLGAPLPPLEVHLRLGGRLLTGWLDGCSSAGLVRYRVGTLKPRDRLQLWVRHLVLNALMPAGCPTTSRYLCPDEVWGLRPVADADAHLGRLLELYERGCQAPLHFYPSSAYAYADAAKEPLQAARRVWEGNEFMGIAGEGDDPYLRVALRGSEPLDEAFEQLAMAVFGPMLAAAESEE